MLKPAIHELPICHVSICHVSPQLSPTLLRLLFLYQLSSPSQPDGRKQEIGVSTCVARRVRKSRKAGVQWKQAETTAEDERLNVFCNEKKFWARLLRLLSVVCNVSKDVTVRWWPMCRRRGGHNKPVSRSLLSTCMTFYPQGPLHTCYANTQKYISK